MTRHHDIIIQGPLPLGVAAALSSMIGTVWPDAQLVMDADAHPSARGGFVFRVPVGDQEPGTLTAKEAQGFREQVAEAEREGANDATIMSLTEDGFTGQLPEDLARALAQMVMTLFQAYEGANYLSLPLTLPPAEYGGVRRRYEIVVQDSDKPSPHEMRERAEARVAELEAEIARLTRHP